jgi:hypothetical protein
MDEESDILVELASFRDELNKSKALKDKVAELEAEKATITKEKDGVAEKATALEAENKALKTEKAALITDSMNSMIEAKVKMPQAREVVNHLHKGKTFETRDEMVKEVEAVLALSYVKEMLEKEVGREMGGRQSRPADKANNGDKPKMSDYFVSPEGEES